jgi:ligand-binding sensor domain-containing protein
MLKHYTSPIIVAALAVTNTAFAQWHQSTGTGSLNMQSLISRENHVFAGGATGAYRSDTSAISFNSSNSGNDSTGPTRGFATDASYVYTCTSQGVFRSANNGATWISKSAGMTNTLTSGIIQVQSHLFVVGPTGVFRSDNQGDSWAAAGMVGVDVRCVTAVDSNVFVGTNGSGVYMSTNWGSTWTAVNTGLASTNIRAIETKGTSLFAGGQIGTGVYRSTNLGASWTLLGGGLTSGSYRGFAHDDRMIVAGSFGGGVFYSVDNGDHWIAINSGLTDLTIFDLEIYQGTLVAATNTQGVFRFAISNTFDLTGDSCIDGSDLSSFLSAWGTCTDCAADFNGDNSVDGNDFSFLLSNWGACGS